MLLLIFHQFFLLGCTSFGGPAAHLGFFRTHFVNRLNWLSDKEYSAMVSLSQLLPGPGSSQVGFAIGLHKAGILGGIAAFLGFTLPSFLIMLILAMSASFLQDSFVGVIHGLKLFAVVVVADAIVGMAKTFCKTKSLKLVAVISTLFLIVSPALYSQIWVIALAAMAGYCYHFIKLDDTTTPSTKHSKFNWPVLISLIILFLLSVVFFSDTLFGQFFYAGSFVFGGGHVVLPLLHQSIPSLTQENFLTAYAAAQAVPGPMFTIAAYLGATLDPHSPVFAALIATIALFLPGLLLMWASINSWERFNNSPKFASITAAINAAVIGLLAAAFYQPIWQTAVTEYWHIALVFTGFIIHRLFSPPIWILLLAFTLLGIILK